MLKTFTFENVFANRDNWSRGKGTNQSRRGKKNKLYYK